MTRVQIKGMSDPEGTEISELLGKYISKFSEEKDSTNTQVPKVGYIPAAQTAEMAAAPVQHGEVKEIAFEKKVAVIQCVQNAMDMMGQTGKEVFLEIVYREYGLVVDDAVDAPRKFIHAAKYFLGPSASILERRALDEIEQKLKISASSLERAVALLGGGASVVEDSARVVLKKRFATERRSKPSSPKRYEYHYSTSA